MKTNIKIGDAVKYNGEYGVIDEISNEGYGFITSKPTSGTWISRFIFMKEIEGGNVSLTKLTSTAEKEVATQAAIGYLKAEVRSIAFYMKRNIFSEKGMVIMKQRKAKFQELQNYLEQK